MTHLTASKLIELTSSVSIFSANSVNSASFNEISFKPLLCSIGLGFDPVISSTFVVLETGRWDSKRFVLPKTLKKLYFCNIAPRYSKFFVKAPPYYKSIPLVMNISIPFRFWAGFVTDFEASLELIDSKNKVTTLKNCNCEAIYFM